MTLQDILEKLRSRFPDAVYDVQQGQVGGSWLTVPAESIMPTMHFLKEELGLTYLACLSGIDYSIFMAIVYQLRSLEKKTELTVKVVLPRENAQVESISSLFGNAAWFEREAFDLLGIQFSGHPDLRRLMMPADWEGHPLRKDYVEGKEYHGISTERPSGHRVLDHLSPQKSASDVDAEKE